MTDPVALRARFLRDASPRRLGNLAANLARIETFSAEPEHRDVVRHLAEESAFFIEWAAPDAALDVQGQLLVLQRTLVRWIRTWDETWSDPQQRQIMTKTAGQWARELLQIAGLI